MNTILTTAGIQEPERFSFWREIVCHNVIHLDIRRNFSQPAFHGTIKSSRIGALQFANVQSISQIAERSNYQIAKSTEETNVFCFNFSGTQKLTYQKEIHQLCPGEWVILDSNLPFKWLFQNNHMQLTLKIPKEKLRARANLPDQHRAHFFPGAKGLGKIVFDTIESFWKEADNLLEEQAIYSENLIIELLANVLADRLQNPYNKNRCHFLRMVEIKAFIKNHLRNPQLSVNYIADAFHISPRYLHFLFKDENKTVRRYIRELRLNRCRCDLENRLLYHRSITEICYYWGFNDSSHFSKLFKSYFGTSPKHYRNEWKNTKGSGGGSGLTESCGKMQSRANKP